MTVHLPFVVLSRDVQLHTSLFSVSISLSLLLSLSTISRQNKLSWKKHVICLFCKTHTTHKFTMHTLTCSPFGKKKYLHVVFHWLHIDIYRMQEHTVSSLSSFTNINIHLQINYTLKCSTPKTKGKSDEMFGNVTRQPEQLPCSNQLVTITVI